MDQHDRLRSGFWEQAKAHEYFASSFVSQVEDVYLQQRAALLQLEKSLLQVLPTESSCRQAPRDCSDASSAVSSLPRIQLPRFFGRYEDWPAFRDLFSVMIVRESRLSNVEKLHYLRASVLGDAARLIQGLAVTEDNFQQAWSTLSGHFNNPRVLVRACLSAFFGAPENEIRVSDRSQKNLQRCAGDCRIFGGSRKADY